MRKKRSNPPPRRCADPRTPSLPFKRRRLVRNCRRRLPAPCTMHSRSSEVGRGVVGGVGGTSAPSDSNLRRSAPRPALPLQCKQHYLCSAKQPLITHERGGVEVGGEGARLQTPAHPTAIKHSLKARCLILAHSSLSEEFFFFR